MLTGTGMEVHANGWLDLKAVERMDKSGETGYVTGIFLFLPSLIVKCIQLLLIVPTMFESSGRRTLTLRIGTDIVFSEVDDFSLLRLELILAATVSAEAISGSGNFYFTCPT